MFVHVFCTFVSGLILLFLDNLWFVDLRAGEKKETDWTLFLAQMESFVVDWAQNT